MQRMDVFSQNYLVIGLPPAAIDQIGALAVEETYGAGDTLIHSGDNSSDLFVVLEGHAHVVTDDDNYLASTGPGGLIGEVALVDAQPRSADVQARGALVVARLPAKELRQYMAQNREIGFIMLANLCRVLSMRLRKANVELDELKDKAKDDPWNLAI